MEPSQPFGDAPCPHCGCLLRFEPLNDGVRVSVAKSTERVTDTSEARAMYACPKCKTRIPFGTETKPPPDHCPTCKRRLFIPTHLTTLPPEWLAKPQSDPERLSGRTAMQGAKNLARYLWAKLRTMWYNVHVG